jgi:hypothetical protein
MDNAINFGYTFEIIKGYQFKQGDLFSKFVNTLYELRLKYPKGDPMNLIAKLLMNSLYGKFGMGTELTKMDIFSVKTIEDTANVIKIVESYGESIHDWTIFDDYAIIVRNAKLEYLTQKDGTLYHESDINVAIASTITAAARSYMSIIKNKHFRLYYSDTDNGVIDAELLEELVGSALGQFKLEHTVEKAIFLAPKIYALITDKGEEIIKVKGKTPLAASTLTFKDL